MVKLSKSCPRVAARKSSYSLGCYAGTIAAELQVIWEMSDPSSSHSNFADGRHSRSRGAEISTATGEPGFATQDWRNLIMLLLFGVAAMAFGPIDEPLYPTCSSLSNWHSCKGANAGDAGVIEVPGIRIDTFIGDKTRPTIIKMDVEGYELEVLRGATETLRHVRAIFLELHGEVLSHGEIVELIDLLTDSGLSPSLIVQYDWPSLSRIYPPSHIKFIRAGDRGTYELFFERADHAVETSPQAVD